MRHARWTAHEGPVRCLAVARDGAILASGGDDGRAKLWEFPGGALLKELAPGLPSGESAAGAPPNAVMAAAFSENGDLVYVVDQTGEALAYSPASGSLAWRARIDGLTGNVGIAATAAQRGVVALGRPSAIEIRRSLARSADDTILLYSLDERRSIGRITWCPCFGFGYDHIIHSIALSPDASTLAIAGLDTSFDTDGDWLGYRCYAGLFRVDPIEEIGALLLDSDMAPPWDCRQAVALHPAGTHIALASTSLVRGAEHTYVVGGRKVVAASQIKPPGYYEDIDKRSEIDDPFQDLGGLDVEPTALAFSPDGTYLAMADGAGAAIADWMLGTGGYHDALGCDGAVTSVVFSPSGRAIVYGRADGSIEIVGLP